MANKFCTPLFGLLLLFFSSAALSQNVGIGIASPNNSAQLDISSTSRGLLIPRMSTDGIAAISNPARGLLVYDSVKNQLMVNMGNASSPNWQSTVTGSGWSLSGNSGTDPATQFIGSTDNNPVSFRVNNIAAGKMDAAGNVFWGLRAGQANSTGGYSNIAIGTDALRSKNTIRVIAIGDSALMNNSESENVGIGLRALMSNTQGGNNVAVGSDCLPDNTTGGNNLGLGNAAMLVNTTGSDNTAIGHTALYVNSTGSGNVAVGESALSSNNGNYNTAVGIRALNANNLSYYNTAVGYEAGLSTADLGYNNVFLGANTGTQGAGFYNCIAIGQDVYCSSSNQVRIGNQATAIIGGWVGWSTFSDRRIKKDVSEDVKGLDFIRKLRPVTYRYDMAAIDQRRPSHGLARTAAARPNPSENENRRFSGFIAQEVEQASQQSGYDFAGVGKPKNDNDLYTLQYSEFVVPLVKSTQELDAKVDRLEKEIILLKQQIALLLNKK